MFPRQTVTFGFSAGAGAEPYEALQAGRHLVDRAGGHVHVHVHVHVIFGPSGKAGQLRSNLLNKLQEMLLSDITYVVNRKIYIHILVLHRTRGIEVT